MKRAPAPRPRVDRDLRIEHASGNVIDFPMVQDLASLLWVVNLGCIDLNPWYARCDDVDRPDYLHFDLDPVPGRDLRRACVETALHRARGAATRSACRADRQDHRLARRARLRSHRARADAKGRCGPSPSAARTSSPRSIRRSSPPSTASPSARRGACSSTTTRTPGAAPWPRSIRRGRRPSATVSTPVTWNEIERRRRDRGLSHRQRSGAASQKVGDLWAPLLAARGRFDLARLL